MAGTPEPGTVSSVPPQAIRVLLCDDAEEIRALLRDVLEQDPAIEVVGEADTGAEGLRLSAELEPDVVLLDLSMPDVEVLEALTAIAASAPRSGIIVFSGFAADRMQQAALHLGADRYIEKGQSLADISTAIREVAAALPAV
jgi:DNA-binding NarL/FixJ family response regulator